MNVGKRSAPEWLILKVPQLSVIAELLIRGPEPVHFKEGLYTLFWLFATSEPGAGAAARGVVAGFEAGYRGPRRPGEPGRSPRIQHTRDVVSHVRVPRIGPANYIMRPSHRAVSTPLTRARRRHESDTRQRSCREAAPHETQSSTGAAASATANPSPCRRVPGVAGAGLGADANSHFRRQIGHVFLLCSHVVMHIRWK